MMSYDVTDIGDYQWIYPLNDDRPMVDTWATAPPSPVEVTNHTTYRRDQVRRSFAKLEVQVDEAMADGVAANRLATKLASDDVPVILPEIRNRSRAEMS